MSELLIPRTPGEVLRAAREKHRLSIAEVAEATRLKSHVIAALEKDDYSVIPAPLYGKGFIKLYAEQVGLDPEPLIQSYVRQYARSVRPTLKTELPPPAPTMDNGLPAPSPLARFRETSGNALTQVANSAVTTMRDCLQTAMEAWMRFQAARREKPSGPSRLSATRRDYSEAQPLPMGRMVAVGFAIVVVAVLAYSAWSFLAPDKESAAVTAASVSAKPAPTRPVATHRALRVAEPPPAPYIKLK